MQKIVDCHAHIFPSLWEACGFESPEQHALYMQRAMHLHGNQPVRSARDHRIVTEKHLWSAHDPSERGRATGVNFRAGRFGRMEWEKDGEDFYIQFLPPGMQDTASPAEFMITQMDYASIETAVLQNDHIYGNLAEHFAAAAERYPGRFIGLAQVDEAFAYRDDQLHLLEDQLTRLRMKGMYFTVAGFFRNGYEIYYDHAAFDPLWARVKKAGIPVFWVFFGNSPTGTFAEEMARFLRFQERQGGIPSVIVHGWPTAGLAGEDGRIVFPDWLTALMEQYPVYSEILYPISWGGRTDYPYVRAQDHIRQLYDRFGPDRLMWGSDMPNVERYCTYRQSLSYVSEYCGFFTEQDRDKIFRHNTLSLLGVDH